MQDARTVLKDVLNCTYMEVDMLLQTNIDISTTVQYLTEEGIGLSMANLYYHDFHNEVCDRLQDLALFKESDFQLYYNGTQDTHIYVKGSKAKYYWNNAPEAMDEIENIFDMEFEET